MPSILAIDQSTSATKAVLFDLQGAVRDSESIPHRQIYPRPGWVEHDAGEIWRNTCAAVRALVARNAAEAGAIRFAGISNQRETVVVFDTKTGEPLVNAMVWQCRRGEEICTRLREAGHEGMAVERTGLRIDPYFSASKLAWLVRERPDIAAKLKSGEARIGTVDTYLVYRLTGGRLFATDHTNASRTLLYDIRRMQWDPGLCELFSVPMSALPEIVESSAVLGESDFGGALAGPVPLCGVMGDSQASLFAHGCFTPGSVKATFGTGSSVLLNAGSEVPRQLGGMVATLAWVHRGSPVYAAEGIINCCAATLSWLAAQLKLIASVDEAEELALSVPDNGGVFLVPAFGGLGAPWWSASARGAVLGLSAHSTRAHVVRAALEAIAYQLRDVIGAMRQQGEALGRICADGGPTANRFLMQFTADITQSEIRVSDSPFMSPRGAVLCGALGMGLYPGTAELAALPQETTVYAPAMTAQRAGDLHDGWKKAVSRVL